MRLRSLRHRVIRGSPPPRSPLAMLAGGVALRRGAPLQRLARVPPGWRIGIGLAVSLAGGFAITASLLALERGGTNVSPYKPSLAVATSGPYARSRNPIYVGGLTGLAGLALTFALDWVLLLFPPGILLLHHGVVLREERYLERKFGGTYRAYKAAVRRYV